MREFDEDRLMIGRIGLPIDIDVTDSTSQIFRHENEVAAIGAICPLRVIIQPAGWRSRHAGPTGCPGIAIVEAGPDGPVNHRVLRIGDVKIEIAAHQARCRDRLAFIGLVGLSGGRLRTG